MLENYQTMDPNLLLSIVNTKLRDFNPSLDDLIRTYDLDMQPLCQRLAQIGYFYQADLNQFKQC